MGTSDYTKYYRWGEDALTVGGFEIIISATLGCLLIRWFSPLLLDKVRADSTRLCDESTGLPTQ